MRTRSPVYISGVSTNTRGYNTLAALLTLTWWESCKAYRKGRSLPLRMIEEGWLSWWTQEGCFRAANSSPDHQLHANTSDAPRRPSHELIRYATGSSTVKIRTRWNRIRVCLATEASILSTSTHLPPPTSQSETCTILALSRSRLWRKL